MSSRYMRQRYWARSIFGWGRLDEAVPNRAHEAIARLEAAGKVQHIITQSKVAPTPTLDVANY